MKSESCATVTPSACGITREAVAKRIAISGSAGVGKSTLARRLADRLGLPYIGEGMREYLEAHATTLHDLGPAGIRRVVLELWERRKAEEAAATDGFVADRCSYDFAAFWLYYHFGEPGGETERLLADTLRPGRYDRVYLLPWGRIPLVADGVRSPNPYTQLHLQLLLEGVLHRHAPAVTELRGLTPDERVAEVLADLGGSPG
jgi:nicotinamide riboside kinase